MKEKVDKILEFIDENRHICDFGCYGCDIDCEHNGTLSSIDVDKIKSMLHDLLED